MSGFSEFAKMSFFLVFQLLDGYTTVGSLINSITVVQLQLFAVNQNIMKMAPYSKNVVKLLSKFSFWEQLLRNYLKGFQ